MCPVGACERGACTVVPSEQPDALVTSDARTSPPGQPHGAIVSGVSICACLGTTVHLDHFRDERTHAQKTVGIMASGDDHTLANVDGFAEVARTDLDAPPGLRTVASYVKLPWEGTRRHPWRLLRLLLTCP
jgi:hypothetical protein